MDQTMPAAMKTVPSAKGCLRATTLLALFALAGCAMESGLSRTGDAPTGPKTESSAFAQFPDIPMPADAVLNMDKTLAFGSDESWIGRLVVKSSLDANAAFDFYRRELPGYRWREITSVRGAVSTMTHARDKRILSVQISRAGLGGTEVTLTVSPREPAKAAPPPPAPPRAGQGLSSSPYRPPAR